MVYNTEKTWKSNLLTIQNAKTSKGEALGYLTGILYLAPSRISVPHGGYNVCPYASAGCEAACLYSAGRGRFTSVQNSRIEKTLNFFHNKEQFMNDLRASIKAVIRKAEREGLKPCIRLNGTSDIGWHKYGIFDEFPDTQFYDYSKGKNRVLENKADNYHLTFSASETNKAEQVEIIQKSAANVAVVFSTKKGDGLPSSYLGRRVIDGDAHDLRFLDRPGSIVGLRAKGDAKKDQSGFVLHV